MMRKPLLLMFTFVLSLTAGAQDVKVKAELDSSDIYIGDQALYTVTVNQPRGIHLFMPVYGDTLMENIEIISQQAVDSSYDDSGDLVLKKKYTITSFDTGYYQIPPFYLEYETGSGKKRFYSDYVPLMVSRVGISLPDSTDVIFDILGPEKVRYGTAEILPWVMVAIVLLITGWLVYRYMRGRAGQKNEDMQSMPEEPIHIITFRELDKLEKKKLWQAGRVKEYYSRLTDILRYYIWIRFRVRALEMTSDEILSALADEEIEKGELIPLKKVLQNADLSKFARYAPGAEMNMAAMDHARHFVKQTYIIKSADDEADDNIIEEEGKEGGNE